MAIKANNTYIKIELSITRLLRNANQHHSEISPHLCRMAIKQRKITNLVIIVEKGEHILVQPVEGAIAISINQGIVLPCKE